MSSINPFPTLLSIIAEQHASLSHIHEAINTTVPAMSSGFVIQTASGSFFVSSAWAHEFQAVADKMLHELQYQAQIRAL